MQKRMAEGAKIPKFCGRHMWIAPKLTTEARKCLHRSTNASVAAIHAHVYPKHTELSNDVS